MVQKILTPLLAKPSSAAEPSLYKKIMLTLDGSALAEQALPYAIAQAQHFGAQLILLQVIPPLLEARSPETEALAAAEVHQKLEPIATRVRAAGIDVAIVSVEGGGGTGPASTIVHYAAQNAIDLVVMSTRGHGGFDRWLLGSTADGVVRKASVPVLLVRVSAPSEVEEV